MIFKGIIANERLSELEVSLTLGDQLSAERFRCSARTMTAPILQSDGASATATALADTATNTTVCCTYFCTGYRILAADGRKDTTIYVCYYYCGS